MGRRWGLRLYGRLLVPLADLLLRSAGRESQRIGRSNPHAPQTNKSAWTGQRTATSTPHGRRNGALWGVLVPRLRPMADASGTGAAGETARPRVVPRGHVRRSARAPLR
jgi:hypothetical protein